MPIETASLFFAVKEPRTALARVLTTLRDQRLLADDAVDADADALKGEPALGPLFVSGRASLDDFLRVIAAASSQGAQRVRFFYVRLAAPDTWPADWRAAVEARLGEQPDAPGELVHIHPYEIVITLDLADLDGTATAARLSCLKHRAHPHLPAGMRMVDDEGESISTRSGFELRCPPETVGVLAFALEKCALLDGLVLVRVLE